MWYSLPLVISFLDTSFNKSGSLGETKDSSNFSQLLAVLAREGHRWGTIASLPAVSVPRTTFVEMEKLWVVEWMEMRKKGEGEGDGDDKEIKRKLGEIQKITR